MLEIKNLNAEKEIIYCFKFFEERSNAEIERFMHQDKSELIVLPINNSQVTIHAELTAWPSFMLALPVVHLLKIILGQ